LDQKQIFAQCRKDAKESESSLDLGFETEQRIWFNGFLCAFAALRETNGSHA
jgi:hypothetical protein